MERTCKKCGETKPIEKFAKNRKRYSSICKECYKKARNKKNHKKYYLKNKQIILERTKKYTDLNRERILDYKRKMYQKYKKQGKFGEEYKLRNKIASKKYRDLHKERTLTAGRKSKALHKEQVIEWNKLYRQKYKKEISKKSKDAISQMYDYYIVNLIKETTGLKISVSRQHPELIENYRKQLDLKRKLKTIKNEKGIKTS